MDVLLLGGALSLPPAILSLKQHSSSNCYNIKAVRMLSPLSISLGLSLILFALSVLEATPSSWLMFLNNQVSESTDDGGSRDDASEYCWTVSQAYFLVLSMMSIYILVICPSLAGVLMLERVLDRPDCNLLCCCSGMETPWWFKFTTGLTSALYKVTIMLLTVVYLVVQKCSTKCWRLCFGKKGGGLSRRDSNHEQKSLPMTKTDTDSSPNTNTRSGCNTMGRVARRIQESFVRKGGRFLLGGVLGVTVTYGVLHFLAPFIIQPKATGNTLALALSWVCAIGIVLSTLLNGFGSVSMPHLCLAGLFLAPIRPASVTKAMVDLEKTEESLLTRRQQLKEIGLRPVAISTSSTNNTTTKSSFFGGGTKRLVKNFSGLGEEVKQKKLKILEEICFLEVLVEEMKEDIEDMKYTHAMETASRTTTGRVHSVMGVLFSLILLARLYSAFTAIMHRWYQISADTVDYQPPKKRDTVTSLVLWLLGHHLVSEKDYDQVSQFISLFLTAFLCFSQVRAFLRTVEAIHRRLNHLFCGPSITSSRVTTPRGESSSVAATDKSQTESGGVYVHAQAALMGSYFLACIILSKMMVPWQYRSSFSEALGGFDAFIIQSDLITILYTFSAVVSATVLALLFSIQKQNAVRHNVSWKDDLGTTKDLDV